MKLDLLREWLKLPAGAWPPDHYTLLGLPAGEGDVDQVEQHALDRMERLRHYQIRHPEEVTEGMNRLAQAMICLTDPPARRDYDRALGLSTPEPEPVEDVPEDTLEDVSVADTAEEPAPEIFDLDDAQPLDLEPAVEVVYEGQEPPGGEPARLRVEETPAPPAPIPPPVEIPFSMAEELRERRRELYARLARVRKVLRLWERLRPHLADPQQPLSNRGDALALSATLAELQPIFPGHVDALGDPGQPGHLIAALARQPLVIETFRGLLPSQRVAYAQEWQNVHQLLRRERRSLREEVRALRPRNWSRRVLLPFGRSLARSPEWGLVAAGACALIIAAVRSW